ncbi:hCG2039828, isoform CRA_e [Homo sapiens]|nr:hCG2039828, isoform CRA_e [Homo sapiens]
MARASSGNGSEEAWGALRAPQQQSPAASSLEGAIWRRAGTQTRALDAILYHPQQSHLTDSCYSKSSSTLTALQIFQHSSQHPPLPPSLQAELGSQASRAVPRSEQPALPL